MLARRELAVLTRPSRYRWPRLAGTFSHIAALIADPEFEAIALLCATGWLASLWFTFHIPDCSAAFEALGQ
jgi:hypothetical protein